MTDSLIERMARVHMAASGRGSFDKLGAYGQQNELIGIRAALAVLPSGIQAMIDKADD